MSNQKIQSILELADNALILGHRLSEWCGHGPILEQDIALTNAALDHIGQARNFYQYAAQLINKQPFEERKKLFNSASLSTKETDYTEDDLAYLRDAWDYKNVLLVEQPNTDWAYTLARSFFYDHFNFLLFTELNQLSNDDQMKAITQKSLKEVTYHKRWSSEWIIRLGDGTEESHERIQQALNDLWPYTQELFENNEYAGTSIDMEQLKGKWLEAIQEILKEATLEMLPADAWMHSGGKKGIHSEHLGYLLAELQFVQRAYPNMEW